MTGRARAMTALLLAAAALTAPSQAAGVVPGITVILDGVDNPRNLAFAPNGDLYVPAAGTGGDEGCGTQQEGYFCSGLTGAVLRVSAAQLAAPTETPLQAAVVADGLVSMSWPGGTVGHGVHAVVARDDGIYALFIGPEFLGTTGSEHCCRDGVSPELREAALAQLGNLVRLGSQGTIAAVADVDHFEFSQNPIAVPHSNPYDVVVDIDGTFLVVDAAGNTLLRVGDDGTVELIAVFPDMSTGTGDGATEAVPTGIAVGPDGNYYVSLLGGFNFGAARIVRVDRFTGSSEVLAQGLTMLTNLAVGSDGTIYATAVDPGAIVRLRPDGLGSYQAPEHLYGGRLVAPTGVDVGPDEMLYVSDIGVVPGGVPVAHGRVLRLAV